MTLKQTLVPVGALVMALSVGGFTAEAGQRDRNGRDRNGRSSQGGAPERQDNGGSARRDSGQDRGGRVEGNRPDDRSARDRGDRAVVPDRRTDNDRDDRARQSPPASAYRYDDRGRRDDRARDNDRYRDNGRYRDNDRYRDSYRYRDNDRYRLYAPRVYRPAPRRYYGPGGGYSVYFGLGNGYLYGSRWSGRVYGYRAPYAYGASVYYGDVRLLVQPRDAAVYVDGYYAGVVDSFDGVFQRLTLEVGPHTIELEVPGLEPQVFEIYVDPARTTTIRADLFR